MSLNVIIAAVLIGGWFLSKLFSKAKLPGILGMMVWGLILGGVGAVKREHIAAVEPMLKNLALIVILLRAGLGLSKSVLQKAGKTALLMAFIPCLFEGVALILLVHYFFAFNWYIAGVTGFMIAAVSPAVIVPTMLELKEKGLGSKNEVPSIILAGASADDVLAITLFSIFLSLSTTSNVNVIKSILSVPLALVLGVIPGIVCGLFFVRYFKKNHEKVRATEKLLILLAGSMLLVQLGELTHSAALLGIMTIGIILLEKAEDAAHEMAHKLKKVWIFAEIILFVFIGLSVDIPTALAAGLKGALVIAGGLVFRSVGVWMATMKSPLSAKERLFCVIAYLPKATVQAALGSVALQNGLPEGNTILALAVLSIMITAPIGLIGIKLFGQRLLHVKL